MNISTTPMLDTDEIATKSCKGQVNFGTVAEPCPFTATPGLDLCERHSRARESTRRLLQEIKDRNALSEAHLVTAKRLSEHLAGLGFKSAKPYYSTASESYTGGVVLASRADVARLIATLS